MSVEPMSWSQAVGDVVRGAGLATASKPTLDDVWYAAQTLGVTVSELLEAAELHRQHYLATVQN